MDEKPNVVLSRLLMPFHGSGGFSTGGKGKYSRKLALNGQSMLGRDQEREEAASQGPSPQAGRPCQHRTQDYRGTRIGVTLSFTSCGLRYLGLFDTAVPWPGHSLG